MMHGHMNVKLVDDLIALDVETRGPLTLMSFSCSLCSAYSIF